MNAKIPIIGVKFCGAEVCFPLSRSFPEFLFYTNTHYSYNYIVSSPAMER